MYEKLSKIFELGNGDQLNELLEQFFGFEFHESDDMAHNINEIQRIAFRMNTIEENTKINDSMIMTKMMSILPASFKYFTTAWSSTSKYEGTLDNRITRLHSEENFYEDLVAFKLVKSEKTSVQKEKGFLLF